MLSHFSLHVLCFGVLFAVGAPNAESASQLWGLPTKYAAPIFDAEITRSPPEAPWVDVQYPDPATGDSGDYTIVSMLAFDVLSADRSGGSALLLAGGVNHNYTAVRFTTCSDCSLHFRFTVYGLQL